MARKSITLLLIVILALGLGGYGPAACASSDAEGDVIIITESPQNLEIAINSINQLPEGGVDVKFSATSDGAPQKAAFEGESASTAIDGKFGTLSLNSQTGEYTYKLNADGAFSLSIEGSPDSQLSNAIDFAPDAQGKQQPVSQTVSNGASRWTNYNPDTVLVSTSGDFTSVQPGAGVILRTSSAGSEIIDVEVKPDGSISASYDRQSVILFNGKPASSATISIGQTARVGLASNKSQPSTPVVVGSRTVSVRVLNVRSGPGTTYSIVGKLARGAAVQVLEMVASSKWAKIKFGTGVAYVSATYLA